MDPSHISPFSTPNLFAVLPDRETSDRVVQYSLDRVGWQHGAVHAGNFKAECEEFFGWGTRRGELVNQAWLALYYAILYSAHHFNERHWRADPPPSAALEPSTCRLKIELNADSFPVRPTWAWSFLPLGLKKVSRRRRAPEGIF